MSLKQKWATVQLGEFTVPLIGVAPDATEERCDGCRCIEHLKDICLVGTKFLCARCRTTHHEPKTKTGV